MSASPRDIASFDVVVPPYFCRLSSRVVLWWSKTPSKHPLFYLFSGAIGLTQWVLLSVLREAVEDCRVAFKLSHVCARLGCREEGS